MIGLSPLSTPHPLGFQPKWVRPSTGSYPRFSLPTDSSPGFASAACDSIALFRLAFATARCPLTSPHTATRRLILQKARGHRCQGGSRCLWAHGFRRCFTPLSGCFSPFPHGTGSLSVAGECSALEGGPPCFPPGFTCPALLWAADRRPPRLRVRGSHPVPPAFPGRSAAEAVSDRRRGMQPPATAPNNPRAETPARLHAHGFGLARFRSPLLPGSRLISLPRGT